MDQIADLILTPFRDIVEKGRAAVDVAGSGHPEMAKAAQSLIKEGGRALKRIEPQCQRHADEFGTSFVDAVKASDDIAAFRTELNDLLWEFDDYTELDHFDVSKYTELQQASRQAAPRIYDILMRMRIEPLANRPISIYGGSSNDNGSMNAFPHLGISTTNDETDTNNSFVPSPHPHNTATGHSHQRSTASVSQLDAIGIHHQKPQGIALNPEAIPQPQTSHFQLAPAVPLSQPSAPAPPEPPSENPWDISLKPGVVFDDGPIPIETESPTQQSSSSALIGPNSKAYNPVRITNDSSYHIFKGFCKGARAVLNGEESITPIRKKTLTGSRVVARCIHYRGNFTFGDMGFRPRLLQKSHVATRRNDEQFYACLICVDLEQTVEESDATIFFTQNDLLSHLSRHPRPFPDIDKLKIVQSPTVPEDLINNYDLHVKSPQAISLTVEKAEEISNMPTAICKETIKSIYGMRTLNDHTPVFEMAEGARIVGIEFLERYEGEWCMGYHDNRYASFPFDVVRLEPPPAGQIQRKSTSTVQAVARWKFTPRIKGKNDWLTFNKGDLISNIAFVSPNHWCWSGTNSKGKWGLFLASHVDPTSIKERAMTGDSLSSATSGNSPPTRASGIFGLFTPKKKTDRKSPLPLAW
ncbi:sh3 domain-containing protein [Ceratocystis lukuohia]|uniref:Sh3 domain-containing protein n=1 Tax=Ceratocystis lukuohia TaxID=2019550 RepID=A0ABR4MPE4_9PEZI